VYDTVGEMGWRPDVTHHPIRHVITKVLEDEREWEGGRQVPKARREKDCFVCLPSWLFLVLPRDADGLAAGLHKVGV
jgi:putative lipase involved disintegration of autophagic bodies